MKAWEGTERLHGIQFLLYILDECTPALKHVRAIGTVTSFSTYLPMPPHPTFCLGRVKLYAQLVLCSKSIGLHGREAMCSQGFVGLGYQAPDSSRITLLSSLYLVTSVNFQTGGGGVMVGYSPGWLLRG